MVSEANYDTTKFFTKNLLAIETKKTQILMNKPVYLGLPILELNETAMYEFWYDNIKPKYGEKEKLYYMDTDSSIAYIETADIYEDIIEDLEKCSTLQIMSWKGHYQKEITRLLLAS